MTKIYTKTGDSGETSLYGGKRVLKSDLRIESYGSVDELNSIIGVVISEIQNSRLRQGFGGQAEVKIDEILKDIQKDLMIIGSLLAGYKVKSQNSIVKSQKLEKWIDQLENDLPELRKFILPGGSKTGSLLHLARTVCRRAERRVVELSRKEIVDKNIIIYLNRLSDLFFVMARFINKEEKVTEVVWQI